MKTVFMTLALVLGLSQANATAAPAWACSMHFKGEASGVKILVGFYNFNGTGNLNCTSATGERKLYPIKLTMKAAPLSPQISFGKMELNGLAADISLFNTNPDALLGNYYIAQGQAAIIAGVGIITAIHTNPPEVALKISLQFAKGFGINLGLNRLKIELDQSRM